MLLVQVAGDCSGSGAEGSWQELLHRPVLCKDTLHCCMSLWFTCSNLQVAPPSAGGGRHSHYAKVKICGKDVSMRIVDNPGRQQLVPAIMVIMLFDLTQQVSMLLGDPLHPRIWAQPHTHASRDPSLSHDFAGILQEPAAPAGGSPASVSCRPEGSGRHKDRPAG